MASNLKVSTTTANAEANALVGSFTNSSTIKIYDGAQPSTPEIAISTQNLLATITLPASSAFGAASAGVITAAAISDITIGASGTAAWFRWWKADGTTPIADGSVGTSGADLNLNSTSLSSGATLSTTSFTFTVPAV